MTGINKGGELGRLEDFVELGRQGNRIEAEVELRKQSMIQKINTEGADDSGGDIETYLLMADYTFRMRDQTHKISKVYMFAVATESARAARANTTIANARLQVDYERLKAANVAFSERFF